MRRLAIVALAGAGTAVLVSAGASPASAPRVTRDRAVAIALKQLKPRRGSVVFALAKPLGPKQRVGEASGRQGVTGKSAWLVWADEAPYSLFQHPSRLLLVDAARGRVIRDQRMSWWPLVDGRPPPFLRSRSGYAGPTYRVFGTVSARKTAGATNRRTAGPHVERTVPAGAFKDDCLVVIGAYGDWRFRDNYDEVSGLAGRAGIPVFKTESKVRPYPSVSDLKQTILEASEKGCKDVFVYLFGHGASPIPGGDDPFADGGSFNGDYGKVPGASIPGVSLVPIAANETPPPFSQVPGDQKITSSELRGLFKNFNGAGPDPRLTFKLVVDACWSGRIINDLEKQRPDNLQIVVTATSADRTAVTQLFVPDATGKPTTRGGTLVVNQTVFAAGRYGTRTVTVTVPPNHGDGAGEFTAAFVKAFDAFRASDTQVQEAAAKSRATGLPLLVYAVRDAWSASGRFDVAFQSGLTKPRSSFSEPPANLPPVVTSFSASRAGTHTFYEVKVEDPEGAALTYSWTNSNTCGVFAGNGAEADWNHPHSDSPGSCPNESVHPATIAVTVSDGAWDCAVAYTGGSAAASFDPDEVCVRRS